jgi:hypothetical protein
MRTDLEITDVSLRLEPAAGRLPFIPLVESATVRISPSAFEKMVRTALTMVADRVPVELSLSSAGLLDGGAEIVARVKRSILKADVTVRLAFVAVAHDTIRVKVAGIDAPAWVPTQFVIEQGLAVVSNRPGFSRAEGESSAIDVKPAEVLARRGLPVKLAEPGRWSVDPRASQLVVSFAATS